MQNILELANHFSQATSQLVRTTSADWQVLRNARTHLVPLGSELAVAFSEAIRADTADSAEPGGGAAHLDQEKVDAVQIWLEDLLSGSPGDSFWAESCLVGIGHASDGVPYRCVLAAFQRVQETLLPRLLESLSVESALEVHRAFSRQMATVAAVMVDSAAHAYFTGAAEIGMNDRLLGRMRKVALRKMIDDAREQLPLIEWSNALAVGVPSIDEQHKHLIGLLNGLRDASVRERDSALLGKTLGSLAEYTVYHFEYEERLFAETAYPDAPRHTDTHRRLKGQVGEFASAFQRGSASLSAELFRFLRDWLNGHIRGSDRAYGPWLVGHGVR